MPTASRIDARSVVLSTAEAWRKYVSVGAIVPSLLRPHVRSAWERAHDQGASPWVARAEALTALGTERLREHRAGFIAAASPYMHMLSTAAGEERHAAMLGTADAIVLDVVGDEQSVNGPERVPGPGSLLSEAMCGSNGIGTPLAEGRYVEIVSTEHFIHGFHPFTCHGIPIETVDGKRHGVLSMSVRRPEAAERLHEILVCAAYGIATEMARLELAASVRDVMASGDVEAAKIEALFRQVARLDAGAPPDAARVSDRDALHAMMAVLRAADDVTRRLEQQERAWRELASEGLGAPELVDLTYEATDLLALLAREVESRRVEVTRRVAEERVEVLADRRSLRRDLFRALLRGLDVAAAGGDLAVVIGARRPEGLGCVRVEATPPFGSLAAATPSSDVVCVAGLA